MILRPPRDKIGLNLRKLSFGALLRCPRCWLAVQLAAVLLVAGLAGLGRLRMEPDSKSYVDASRAPLADAMGGIRTLGYPLLLRGVAAVSPDYCLLPWVHLAMLPVVVFFFDFALRRFGVSPWAALAISSPLIYAALPRRTPVACLLSDFAGMMLAVMTVGCLLWVVAERRRILPWLALTLCLAAAYQVRPAYLFLVPLVPCLGIVFALVWSKGRALPPAWKGLAVGLLASATLPLLAYCLVRQKIVGEFGLVSFAGFNRSVLAVELLDRPMIDGELSPRLRPLAREIMAQRQRLGMTPAFGPGLYVDLGQYEANFATDLYKIALPTVRRVCGSEPRLCNRELSDFSREVIGLRKGRYLLWVVESVPRALMKVLWFQWIFGVLFPAAAVLLTVRLWMGHAPQATKTSAGLPSPLVPDDRAAGVRGRGAPARRPENRPRPSASRRSSCCWPCWRGATSSATWA